MHGLELINGVKTNIGQIHSIILFSCPAKYVKKNGKPRYANINLLSWSNIFFQIKTEQALVALEATMESDELRAFQVEEHVKQKIVFFAKMSTETLLISMRRK